MGTGEQWLYADGEWWLDWGSDVDSEWWPDGDRRAMAVRRRRVVADPLTCPILAATTTGSLDDGLDLHEPGPNEPASPTSGSEEPVVSCSRQAHRQCVDVCC
jgi:hypothetical protein